MDDQGYLFDRITRALEGKPRANGSYVCKCPAHDDKNPSLSVSFKDGKILLHCFAGCSQDAVIDALKARGLWEKTSSSNESSYKPPPRKTKTKDPPPVKPIPKGVAYYWHGKQIKDSWTYKDKDGKVLGHVVRYEKDGKKEIIPYFYKNGENWTNGSLKAPRPLYSLNFIRSAPSETTIWIVEGEKCAEALQWVHRLATTSMGGTNAAKFTDWSPLAGRTVRIWPDHDEAGKIYAEEVKLQLKGLMPPSTIEIVDVAKLGLKNKEDAYDWLQVHDKDGLDQIPLVWEDGCSDTDETVENPQVEFISLTEIAKLQIEDKPIIGGLLGEKESLIISALSGVGKSLLVNCMAVSLGKPPEKGLWGLFDILRPIKTLIVQSENSLKSFNMRLNKLFKEYPEMEDGGENVFVVKVGDNCRYIGDIEDKNFQKFLIDSLLSLGAGMLILDPLISYHTEDENDNSPMRKALDQFSVVLEGANVSAIICHHCNRQGLTRGATAISDWADNMLLLTGVARNNGSLTIEVEHSKCRNYEQQNTFYLERTPDLNFLRCGKTIIQAKHVEVAVKILSLRGGFINNQTEFKKAIMVELNCSEAKARRIIEDAIKNDRIIIEPGEGKKKSYYLGNNVESL
jgi:predicted transcriptional regulator